MKCCENLCCTKISNLCVENILENINLHIHCGEITAIIGPNGAGKSTLLKAIIGERKHSGQITFTDEKGNTKPIIGYVPQSLGFDGDCPATVKDLFLTCESLKQQEIINHLKIVDADELINQKLCLLSGGELQRVMLGLALLPIPNLLLLDEPISGVDQKGIEKFWDTLTFLRKKYDMTIIIVSHNLSQVKKYSDRVILLNKTILSSGTPEIVFASNEYKNEFGI